MVALPSTLGFADRRFVPGPALLFSMVLLVTIAVTNGEITLSPNETLPFTGQPLFVSGLYNNVDEPLPLGAAFWPIAAVAQKVGPNGLLETSTGVDVSYQCIDDNTFIGLTTYVDYATQEKSKACAIVRYVDGAFYRVAEIKAPTDEITCPELKELEDYVTNGKGKPIVSEDGKYTRATKLERIADDLLPTPNITTCVNQSFPIPASAPTGAIPAGNPGTNECPPLPPPPASLNYGRGIWAQNGEPDTPGVIIVHSGLEYGVMGWAEGVLTGSDYFDSYFTIGKVVGHECVNETTDNFVMEMQMRYMNGSVVAAYVCETRTIDLETKTMTLSPLGMPNMAMTYRLLTDTPGNDVVDTCLDAVEAAGPAAAPAPGPAPPASGTPGGIRLGRSGFIWAAIAMIVAVLY